MSPQKNVEEGSSTYSEASEEDFVISNWQIFLILLNVIDHVLILGTVGYLCWLARDLSNVTNVHALLCTIGYVLLMAEAIVALAGENTWTFWLSRRGNSNLHWIFQVIGGTCIFVGIFLKYNEKTRHITTLHGLLGIISCGCIAVVFLSGSLALFAGSLRKRIKPVFSKFAHNSLGMFCFVTGMAAQVDAYIDKGWVRTRAGDRAVYVLTITTVLITLLSLPGALRQLNQQFRGVVRVLRK